jgi:mono/diheme cytochrome c family protein
MRHVLANILTYAIAALLFIGAAMFAWMRSGQVMITTEATLLAGYQTAEPHVFRWHELGRSSYARNCANCHGGDGTGWDQYPPLHRSGAMLETDRGRDHLIDLHLYGLTSDRWGAPMPPMGHIRDVELAAVINYIASTFGDAGDDRLLVPAAIEARRGLRRSPADVERDRPAFDP